MWEFRAVEASEVSELRCVGDEEDVMSGVRVESVRWRESDGCWAGRFVILAAVWGCDEGCSWLMVVGAHEGAQDSKAP